jgi:hypothetical protein
MNFDAAWRAFEQDDIRIKAPAVLEARVLHALGTPRAAKSQRQIVLVKLGLVAAAATLAFAFLAWRPGDAPPSAKLPSRPLASHSVPAAFKLAVGQDRPVIPAVRPHSSSRSRDTTIATITLEFPEALQVVRIRIPRAALETLGLVLLEPDAEGVVDVDVLVGEDGLPRDLSHVRAGQE